MREGYEVHYIVLRASKEETLRRAIARDKLNRKTNIELVEAMWGQFAHLGEYEANVIDSTCCTDAETADRVQEALAKGSCRLYFMEEDSE